MLKRLLVLIALATLAACGTQAKESAAERAVPEPSLEKIADGVWIHKSYQWADPWGLILSQGMVVKGDGGVYLVDTAWNDADTEQLLDLIEAKTGQLPVVAIITHAHQDKMGGVNALHARNINTVAHAFSNEDAPARGLTPAKIGWSFDESSGHIITGGGIEYELLYPGPGHTRDNIVVYYAPGKVLFGGCLIRPGGASTLGNTADGSVANWANAARMVAEEFPDAEIVIPSHGPMGGRGLLDHTIALADAAAHE